MGLTISDISNLAQAFQIPILLVSVLFIYKEIKQNIELTKTSNVQNLSEITMPFMLQLIQDKELYTLLHSADKYDNFDEIDKKRFTNLLSLWMTFHENIFYQFEKGLLDTESYKPWSNDLKNFVCEHKIDQHWEKLKPIYQDSFVKHINSLIQKN